MSSGMSVRVALQVARRMGCSVFPIRGTGEIRVSHPHRQKSCRINGRRKDSPKHLIVFLRKLTRDNCTNSQ